MIYYNRESAARLLNLSKTRICQLYDEGKMPRPDATLSGGSPLWLKQTLVYWVLARKTTPQPPEAP